MQRVFVRRTPVITLAALGLALLGLPAAVTAQSVWPPPNPRDVVILRDQRDVYRGGRDARDDRRCDARVARRDARCAQQLQSVRYDRWRKDSRGFERDVQRYYDRRVDDRRGRGFPASRGLPPGLSRQLRVRGTLPPGLERQIGGLPRDLDRSLSRRDRDYRGGVIGHEVIVWDGLTRVVLDRIALR